MSDTSTVTTRRPGIGGMLAAGVRALPPVRRTIIALYLVELTVALIFMFTAQHALAAMFAHRPAFARAVHGDDRALIAALTDQRQALFTLALGGIALALAYALLSLYTTAGLLGALSGRPFGETAGRRFLAFLRLFLWSLIPVAIGITLAGMIGASTAGSPDEMTHLGRYVGRFFLGAVPGIVVCALTWCAVDYARIDLVTRERTSSFMAFMRGFRQAVRPAAFAHYALYLILWAGLTALYVAVTLDLTFAGVLGALNLFVVRQAVAFTHFMWRIIIYGGQVARARASEPPGPPRVVSPVAPGGGTSVPTPAGSPAEAGGGSSSFAGRGDRRSLDRPEPMA